MGGVIVARPPIVLKAQRDDSLYDLPHLINSIIRTSFRWRFGCHSDEGAQHSICGLGGHIGVTSALAKRRARQNAAKARND